MFLVIYLDFIKRY